LKFPKESRLSWSYIQKAEESLRRWDTKGVFANCRETGYPLNRLIENKFGKESFCQKELWARTYGRFENLASTDLHLEEIKKSSRYAEEDVKVGREEAEAEHVLILTKALVKYAEELFGRQ